MHHMQISAPKDTLQTPGVTPQILSRAVMDPLVVHLESKVGSCWAPNRAYPEHSCMQVLATTRTTLRFI
jgi:hypothetical protein